MKRKHLGLVIVLIVVFLSMAGIGISKQMETEQPSKSQSLVQKGYAITPVPLDLKGKNHDLVGLGSYYVNAVAGCNDCHTCPSYANDPYQNGPPGKVNATNYLAGGVPFGPFISKNITPDPDMQYMPAGLTLKQFVNVIRTGKDPTTGSLLQVMPWPIYRNMTNRDLRAIYEYLSAIPHAVEGTSCTGAGQVASPAP